MCTTLKIGISACLLGNNVRYDGKKRLDPYISGTLAKLFTVIPVCPEVECGLTVPREAMRLEGSPENPSMVAFRSRLDLTPRMQSFCRTKLADLRNEMLSGFILKARSPSCEPFRIRIYAPGVQGKTGIGIFAAALKQEFPLLPMEEEERLGIPEIRENFMERVFAFNRWQEFINTNPTPGDLVAFHTAQKLQIMAHSIDIYRELGRLVATGSTMEKEQLLADYGTLLMKGLSLHATTRKQVNVLQHILGYFKKDLGRWEKKELLDSIEQYRQGIVPLTVPRTLLTHYARKYDKGWLKKQSYLTPQAGETISGDIR